MSIGKRNRSAGIGWELECIKDLKEIGFTHVVSTRSESRNRDDQKIDLMNKDELKNGRLPYNFQCKNVMGKLDYLKVLESMPQDIPPVILHKYTQKSGKIFVTKRKVAILDISVFSRLLNKAEKYEKGFNLLSEYFDSISEEEKIKLDKKLKILGL